MIFRYDESSDAFHFFDTSLSSSSRDDYCVPSYAPDAYGNDDTDIRVPLAPCAYRLADYTFAKREPVLLSRVLNKLGVFRCLRRECDALNALLWRRFHRDDDDDGGPPTPLEEDELGKARFMELLSNVGVHRRVSEMILQRAAMARDAIVRRDEPTGNGNNPHRIPQIKVDGLDDFLRALEDLTPALRIAREEIERTQTVSFYPGLGELFTPGSKLVCYPDGMGGAPVGCSCVQSWYAEELNGAANKIKRRFVLVVEFLVSVGTELAFVAASEVYPEFQDTGGRNQPVKNLTHRKLRPDACATDADLLERLGRRGEFYASVSTRNHYLEYQPNCFYPIIGGGWAANAQRPLSKGGRVMVDVRRGILENHVPHRGTSGMSDTVKEAIKLFEQNKRTGIAVPFRTAILPPGFDGGIPPPTEKEVDQSFEGVDASGGSDRHQLWQAWPCLVGFSFTSRVWGKILLTLPKSHSTAAVVVDKKKESGGPDSPIRTSVVKLGVERAALGGFGECGSLNYITFQEKAFEQLVLEESKKELIRAVARNAGGGARFDDDHDYDSEDSDGEEEEEDMGLDVVANKGAASIFLLNGPPGCGKTLTAEAIAELLKKPLYVVTAGDLGITASEVEKNLGSVLELCQTWDALVLMDEADIFLEARSSTEIQRNALVCVMLRLLEYYSGCLFLSSNRPAASIDAAIASRITVMLSYPPLDSVGRAKVWRNLVGLVPVAPVDCTTGRMPHKIASNPRKASRFRVGFTDDDFRGLASSYEINGRQIKNSIVLARALARERGVPLSLPILRRAVTAVAGEGGANSSARDDMFLGSDRPEFRMASNGNDDEPPARGESLALAATLSDPASDFARRYDAVRSYLDALAKPVGSLGSLEDFAARVSALQRSATPRVDIAACVIFAGDHGVAGDASEGGANCSSYPQAVTRKVLEGLDRGIAGASALARANGAVLRVIDVGLADHPPPEWVGGVVRSSAGGVRGGTRNFCVHDAMTSDEVGRCIQIGRAETGAFVDEAGADVVVFGEVGIGNTTTSSALIAALCGIEDVGSLCGTGASTTRDGIDDDAVGKKVSIIEEAMRYHRGVGTSCALRGEPIRALAAVGGAEISAMVGGMLECSDRDLPILVDGFIVTTAAMIACMIDPQVSRLLLFATRSTERGQAVALGVIRDISIPAPAPPALDMGLRMGEATGALLAVPLVRSACAVMSELATLNEVLGLAP